MSLPPYVYGSHYDILTVELGFVDSMGLDWFLFEWSVWASRCPDELHVDTKEYFMPNKEIFFLKWETQCYIYQQALQNSYFL